MKPKDKVPFTPLYISPSPVSVYQKTPQEKDTEAYNPTDRSVAGTSNDFSIWASGSLT